MKIVIQTFDQLSISRLYDILKLRQQVFVIEQNCIYPDIDGLDPHCIHIMGFDLKNQIVSYLRVIPPEIISESKPTIGRVCVSMDHRNKGLAKTIVIRAIDLCRTKWNTGISLSAQTYIYKFYLDLGFTVCGPEYLEDGIPHIPMHLPL